MNALTGLESVYYALGKNSSDRLYTLFMVGCFIAAIISIIYVKTKDFRWRRQTMREMREALSSRVQFVPSLLRFVYPCISGTLSGRHFLVRVIGDKYRGYNWSIEVTAKSGERFPTFNARDRKTVSAAQSTIWRDTTTGNPSFDTAIRVYAQTSARLALARAEEALPFIQNLIESSHATLQSTDQKIVLSLSGISSSSALNGQWFANLLLTLPRLAELLSQG